jgi:hypothetical protein
VHGDPAEVPVDDLALAGVHPGPQRQPPTFSSIGDAEGAADGASGAIERRQEPVAEVLHLLAGEPRQVAADVVVMGGKELAPHVVTAGGQLLRGLNDVGEHEGE